MTVVQLIDATNYDRDLAEIGGELQEKKETHEYYYYYCRAAAIFLRK